jgi:hypothetical protein
LQVNMGLEPSESLKQSLKTIGFTADSPAIPQGNEY